MSLADSRNIGPRYLLRFLLAEHFWILAVGAAVPNALLLDLR